MECLAALDVGHRLQAHARFGGGPREDLLADDRVAESGRHCDRYVFSPGAV